MLSILKQTILYRWYKELKGKYAAYVYQYPSHDMIVIGVTGTDGKTTTCNLIYHIFQKVYGKTMIVGTTGVKIDGAGVEGIEKMTSYDPMDLYRLLAAGKENECKYAVLEVSSHGLDQYRFKNIEFSAAVLTNISQEHLDYHKTFDRYATTKQKLFRQLQQSGKEGVAVLPQDDNLGKKRADRMQFKTKITFGLGQGSTIKASHIRMFTDHTEAIIEYHGKSYPGKFPLLARFNMFNVLGAISVAVGLGIEIDDAIEALSDYVQEPGRQEHYFVHDIHWYIDFAHTPMGLEVMLEYLQTIKEGGKVICVFGAPGKRDASKRPLMGKVVERLADVIIVTDDDASTENRWNILKDIMQGIEREEGDNYYVIPERRDAIEMATKIAEPGDIVLLAGKGHEEVLVTNFGKIPWSDKKVLFEALGVEE